MDLKLLYHGFDGLDVSFQCRPEPAFLAMLSAAKSEAQKTQATCKINFFGVDMDVAATGAVGFSFRADTGPAGETWFIANSLKSNGWNVRVSVKSLALATLGYQAVKDRLLKRLEIFTDEVLSHSVGRIDFAVDVEAPDFVLEPENFVCHWRATQGQHRVRNREMVSDSETGEALEIVGNGGKINSVTIGKMPGRQVIVYNKRREVIDRQKSYWWAIWYPDECGAGEVPKEVRARRVWRVEIRSGKRDLKERWNVSTFDQLEASLGAIYAETLSAIRLNAPQAEQTDSNKSRQKVHVLWDMALAHAERPFNEVEKVNPSRVIEITQAQMQERYRALFAGLAASYSVMLGARVGEVPGVLGQDIAASVMQRVKDAPAKFKEAQQRAGKRLRFMTDVTAWQMPRAA